MLTADQVRLLAQETLAVHTLDEDGRCRRCGRKTCEAWLAAQDALATMEGSTGRVWPLA